MKVLVPLHPCDDLIWSVFLSLPHSHSGFNLHFHNDSSLLFVSLTGRVSVQIFCSLYQIIIFFFLGSQVSFFF